MPGSVAAYFDSSALVKLVVPERESLALRTFIVESGWSVIVSSTLAITEVIRTVDLVNASQQARDDAHALLSSLALMELTRPRLVAAADAGPRGLRSLDAIHVATAAWAATGNEPIVPDGIDAVITYDKRMFHAWRDAYAVPVRAPGAPLDRER